MPSRRRAGSGSGSSGCSSGRPSGDGGGGGGRHATRRVVGVVAAFLGGCAPGHRGRSIAADAPSSRSTETAPTTADSGGDRASAGRDSVRGQIQVVGPDPASSVVLRPAGGGAAVPVVGPAVILLRRVDGLGVDAVGTRSADGLVVDRFRVVTANGLPATDGRLTARGDTLMVVTADGRAHTLVDPSPVLRAHVGARVWISGSLDREPVAYGLIEP